jgi:hypothetical protein
MSDATNVKERTMNTLLTILVLSILYFAFRAWAKGGEEE